MAQPRKKPRTQPAEDAAKKSVDSLTFRVNSKFKNTKQKDMYKTILDNRITFAKGTAGTGKTFIALMAALECIKNPNIPISKIMISRQIIEASSVSLGYLKGSLDEKTSPYFSIFYDNLAKMIDKDALTYLKSQDRIKEMIVNFVRGATFGEVDHETGKVTGYVVIIDEAQNFSKQDMLLILSRLGENSKIVVLGDPAQQDLKLKNGEVNGLVDAWDRLNGLDGVGFIEFDEEDIVRDAFLKQIMKRYKV